MYREKKISLSITSCKRWGLLERVLKAFKVFCKDSHVIDKILFYDDSSTDEEKRAMESLLEQLFPDHDRIITHFYPDSFGHNYRHSGVLNDLRDKLRNFEIDYTLHLEDDYLFVNHFSICESVDLLETYTEYGQVHFHCGWLNFPPEITPKEIGNYYEWVYLEDKGLLESLFLDECSAIRSQRGSWYWQTFTNWPYFSLRPSLTNVEKFLSVDDYSTNFDPTLTSTEFEFAARWGEKKYKTLVSKYNHIIDLGLDPSISAYHLNNSIR